MNIRILLADNHELMRRTLRDLIDKHSGMEVLALADSGHSAVVFAWQLEPDVVIMDINMPDLGGASVVNRIISAAPAVKILALSFYPNRQYVERVLKAGASGYLLKDSVHEEMVCAIRSVARNQIFLSSALEKLKYLDWTNKRRMLDVSHSLQAQAVC